MRKALYRLGTWGLNSLSKGTEKVPGHPRFNSESFKYPTFAKTERISSSLLKEKKKQTAAHIRPTSCVCKHTHVRIEAQPDGVITPQWEGMLTNVLIMPHPWFTHWLNLGTWACCTDRHLGKGPESEIWYYGRPPGISSLLEQTASTWRFRRSSLRNENPFPEHCN